MRVEVIDDSPDVRNLYHDVCRGLGHQVTTHADLLEGVEWVARNPCDVIFLDNHFARPMREAIYGVQHLPTIRQNRPQCFVVLMSSKSFSKDMVRMAIENKIEFFIENPTESERIESILRQISLVRQREYALVQGLLSRMKSSSETQESLLARMIDVLARPRQKSISFRVEYLGLTGQEYLLEEMRRVAHVARGDTLVFESTASSTLRESFRAGSKYGLTLGLGDSKSILNSVLGAKIRSVLETSASVEFERSVTRTYSEKMEIAIHEEDVKRGAYSKDVYEGLVFEKHMLGLSMTHSASGLTASCELACFVPKGYVTAVQLKDEMGFPIVDERHQYPLWDVPINVLADLEAGPRSDERGRIPKKK